MTNEDIEKKVDGLEGRVTALEQRRTPGKPGARGLRTEVLCKGIVAWSEAHPEGGEATADELWQLGGGAPPKDVVGARKANGDSLGGWCLGLAKVIYTGRDGKGRPPSFRIDAKAVERALMFLADRGEDEKPQDGEQAAQVTV